MEISNYSKNNEKCTKFRVYKEEAETKLNLNPVLLYGKNETKTKRRMNIPIGAARILHAHPTPDCARTEPGNDGEGQQSHKPVVLTRAL